MNKSAELKRKGIFTKMVASTLIVTLTAANFLFCGEYFVSYATSGNKDDLDKQTDATLHKNVKFDAYFENDNQRTHYNLSDVNGENKNIIVTLEVQKEGYLKNAVVELKDKENGTDKNYEVKDIKDDGNILQKIEKDRLELRQINYDNSIRFEIAINPKLNEKLELDKLNENSKITLKGLYVDGEGKETPIEKDVTINIKWDGTYSAEIKQELVKYIPLNVGGEQKVLVQLKLLSGLNKKENMLPIKETNLDVVIPEFNGVKAEKITITAKSLKATMGIKDEEIVFDEDSWTYNKDTNTLNINVKNEVANGKVNVGTDNDEYLITLMYPKEAYNSIKPEGTKLVSDITSKISIYSYEGNNEIQTSKKEIINLKETTGKLLSIEGDSETESIIKGKIYSNISNPENKYETEYKTRWQINVGYKDSLEGIKLQDEEERFVTLDNRAATLSKNTLYKQTTVSKNSFDKILGENGKIKLYNQEGIQIGTITKDSKTDENGDYLIEYLQDIEKIIMETSKPVEEGNLIINNTKAIKSNLPFNKKQVEQFAALEVKVGLLQKETGSEQYLKIEEKSIQIAMGETNTKSKLTIGKDKLSTLINNEDVEMKIELGNNSESSDLYVDPIFIVEFPSYIENIEIKEAKVLYDDELIIKNIEKYRENDKFMLKIQLEGVQTRFSTGTITNGTNIILKTDIKVNILTPTKTETVNMYYYNSNTINYENVVETRNGKAGLTQTEIEFSAPIGLLSVSNMINYEDTGKQLMSVNQGTQVEQILTYQQPKKARMDMIIINNTGSMCNNFVVLGRLPFKGNKDLETNEDLGTTVDALLTGYISTENLNADNYKVYYSENGEADENLSKKENGWTETPSNLSNIKSYMIVTNNYDMQAGEMIVFSYNFEVPGNLSHNNNMYTGFKTSYTNNTAVATIKETSKSDLIGLTTGRGPELKVEQRVSGASEDGKIDEYRILKYTITVRNDGTESAKGVNIKNDIPKWTKYIKGLGPHANSIFDVEYYSNSSDTETMKNWDVIQNGNDETGENPVVGWYIDEIKPGESIVKEFEILVEDKPGIYEFYKDYSGFTVGEDGKYYIETNKYDADTDRTVTEKNEIKDVPEIDIQNIAIVTAQNLNVELKSAAPTVGVNNTDITVSETSQSIEDGVIEQGDEISYGISIYNKSSNTKSGLVIEKILPEGLEYVNSNIILVNNETGQMSYVPGSYNEDTRKITLKHEALAANESLMVSVNATVENLPEGITEREIKTSTTITTNAGEKYTSNDVIFTVKKPQLIVTHTCTNSNEYINEGDEFEYIITVKNNEDRIIRGLKIKQAIPEGLEVKEATYNMFGVENTTYLDSNNYISIYGTIEAGEEIIVRIKTKVGAVSEDKQILSVAEVYANGMDTIITDGIVQTIEKSKNSKPGNNNGSGNGSNNGSGNGEPTERTFKISGTAWLDENENGQKDNDEKVLENINVTAMNVDTGETTELKTDESGRYLFTNMKKGNYLIVFEYDTKVYTTTEYQKQGVIETVNSDAIEREIDKNGETKIAGITDTIKIENSSISNIDIGLVEKAKFDLSLSKVITQITVQNKEGTKEHKYNNSTLAKVDITGKELKNSLIVIEYAISVTNEGTIAGYAKQLVDYLPKELTFNSEINNNWYLGNDGNLYTTELAEQLINPGETKQVKLILTKKLTEEDTKIINNIAEIAETYNEVGLADRDSTEGNNTQGEDDTGSADVLITVRTGGPVMYVFITLVCTIILAIGIYIINKKVLKNR